MKEKDLRRTSAYRGTTLDEEQELETEKNYAESDFVTPDDDTDAEENEMNTDVDFAHNSVLETEDEYEPFISVQYNHEIKNFTKEEAVNLIQKALHTESLRKKLEYAAAINGMDVNSLINNIVMAPEKEYRKHLEDLYGEDSEDVEIGMQIFREKQSEKYKEIMADNESNIDMENRENEEKSVNSRLAKEYLILKKEIPDAPEYSELPSEVIIEAANGNTDLYSAYLRYLYNEKRKIDAAKKTNETAATASTGAMRSGGENMSSADRNFLSGLWQK